MRALSYLISWLCIIAGGLMIGRLLGWLAWQIWTGGAS